MSEQHRQDIARRTHEADQDWERCKAWWKVETIPNRLAIQDHICATHINPMHERMSMMAHVTLDRLVIEVWPGPNPSELQP